MRDVLNRALKTFVEVFAVTFIPQLVVVLKDVESYDWNQWYIWLVPILLAAVGTGISAAWNGIENYIANKNGDVKN